MSPRALLLLIDIVGGAAVLGSYAWGITTHANPGDALWGGVPASMRPLYQVSMIAATIGYLAFTAYLLFGVDLAAARIAGRFGAGSLLALHLLVLLPSALWMPLTFAWLAEPRAWLWWAVRGLLSIVGLGAVGLTAAIATIEPRGPTWAWMAALIGAVAFTFQTGVLDALIWTAYFRR